jgi:hypothetical protein
VTTRSFGIGYGQPYTTDVLYQFLEDFMILSRCLVRRRLIFRASTSYRGRYDTYVVGFYCLLVFVLARGIYLARPPDACLFDWLAELQGFACTSTVSTQ